jgi:dTDP-4-dehydrorhamnose reductase
MHGRHRRVGMNVLLLGAGGMLAQAIRTVAPPAVHIVGLTHADLDICDEVALQQTVTQLRPDCVINASAYTNVDAAERHPDVAMAVNGTAVANLARLCRENGADMIHFSTEYVFDGKNEAYYVETDEPRPLSHYGKSKLAGERGALAEHDRVLIIRTQWLFGMGGKSFVRAIWNRATTNQDTRVVSDQIGVCTYAADLAGAMWRLAGRTHGLVHYANRGRISRFELARYLFELAGTDAKLSPARSADYGGAARRPANATLSVKVAETLLGEQIPSWQDAIQRFLKELRDSTEEAVTVPDQSF